MSARVVGPINLARWERLPSSFYGNPRFLLIAEDGQSWKTAPDAAVSYEVENLWTRGYRIDRHRVALHLNGRGHVVDVTDWAQR